MIPSTASTFAAIASKVAAPEPGRTVCLMRVGKSWTIGWNDRQKTSPAWRRKYSNGEAYTRHAEMHALQQADRIGGKITHVIVMRFTKDGGLSMARPCAHCREKLDAAGVKTKQIYYTDWQGGLTLLDGDDYGV